MIFTRDEWYLNGFSATPIDDKGNYLWFPIPEISVRSYAYLNDVSICECGIEFVSSNTVLTLNLIDPSQQWKSKSASQTNKVPSSLVSSSFNMFQKYQVIVSERTFTIIDKENESCTGQLTFDRSEKFDGYEKCIMINNDLYIFIKEKMFVIEKLDQKIIEVEGQNNLSPDFEIAIPHFNTTPFVVKEVLFVAGGHDNHCEPFSDIYQFDEYTRSWKQYGHTTVSRYAAEVVVFNDKNEKESVFIVGGFKQRNEPCNVIEYIPVKVS